MLSRSFLIASVTLLGLSWSSIALAQVGDAATPNPEAAVTPATPTAARTVEQAAAAAMTALDQIESGESDQPRRTVLAQVFEHIEFIQDTDPYYPMLSFLFGRTYALAGRYNDAVQQLQAFIDTRDGRNEWRALRLLGDLLVETYPQLAESHYRSAAALKPGEPSVLFGTARCLAKRGRQSEAITTAREAVVADGRQTIDYLTFLAGMLAQAKQWEAAEREAHAALDLAKRDMEAKPGEREAVEVVDQQYRRLVEVLTARVNQGGEVEVDAFVRLSDYLALRAETLVTLSNYDALSVVERGLSVATPAPPPLLLERQGMLLAKIGRTEEAIAVFEQLLDRVPNHPAATAWLAKLRPAGEGE